MEIQYKLTAIVDDEVVFESSYSDTTELESELGKAEDIVGRIVDSAEEEVTKAEFLRDSLREDGVNV